MDQQNTNGDHAEKSVHDPTNCDHVPEWYAEYDEYYEYNCEQAEDEAQEQEAYNALLEMERQERLQQEEQQLVDYIHFLSERAVALHGNIINQQIEAMIESRK